MFHNKSLPRKGFDQGRYARLLQCQWVLYPQTLVVQHLGDYPR